MPTEFFPLLLDPFGGYRHGCDPPDFPPRLVDFPLATGHSRFSEPCLLNLLHIFMIIQRFNGVEPFQQSFRPTLTKTLSAEPANTEFWGKKKR